MTEPNHDKTVDDPRLTAIGAVIETAIATRETKMLEGIAHEVALLGGNIDRTPVAAIEGDRQGAEPVRRGNESIVSRNQPTDPLYRSLHNRKPHYRTARDPDQDHWNATWLRAFLAGDIVTQRMAEAKGNEALQRATAIEGTLNATHDTSLTMTGANIATGAHLLPQSYANVVMIAREAAAVVASLCTNFQATGNTLRVPTMGAITAATAAEGAAVAAGEPTNASEMLILHKLGARCIASDEMLADSAFNLMQLYGERAGTAIGAAEDVQICTTNGTSPNFTEAIAGGDVTETTSTELVYEDLNLIFFDLGKAYQPNSTWLAGTVVCRLLSNMVDSNGQPTLKVPSQAPGPVTDIASPNAIGTVLGRPLYHVPLAAGVLLLGDLAGYAFVRKGGIEAKISTEVGFATDTVQFKFTERADGRIIDDVAMKQAAGLATLG